MDPLDYIKKAEKVLSRFDNIDYVFLFGSVLNHPGPESDVDILVGGDLDFSGRASLAMELGLELKKDVDIVLTKEARCELVLNALSRGIPILVYDEDIVKRDYFKSYRQQEQNVGLRKLRIERMKRRYGLG